MGETMKGPVAPLFNENQELAKKQLDFFINDYNLKVKYLSDHFSRMWTRFNFFLTLESGMLGGKIIFGKGVLNKDISIVLLCISTVWYLFGAQDRHLVALYRDQVKKVAGYITDYLAIGIAYEFVGKPNDSTVFKNLADWYIKPISITRLAALVPFMLIITWLVVVFIIFK